MKMYDLKTCDFPKKGHFSLHGTQIKIAVLNGRGQGNMNTQKYMFGEKNLVNFN